MTGQPSTPPGLAPFRSRLENGAVVLAKETHTTPAVTINLAIRSGTIADPDDAPGAMGVLSRMLDRGTERRSAAAIAEELDARGIALAVGVTRHQCTIACTCLAEDFEPVLALVGEIVMTPSFPESEMAMRKGEVITAIRQDEDNPGARAIEAVMALLYPGGHPYGRPLKGRIDAVEALTRERLVGLHAERFAPSALTAAIVGDVPVGRAADATDRVFGGWRTGPPAPIVLPRVAEATERRRVVIPMMNKAQADIAYGFTGLARHDPAYYACALMNNAFGQYAIGGRLGESIRERQGMAYYVFSSFEASPIESPLVIRAGVGPANVDRAIASIDEAITLLTREGLTERELNESRQYVTGSMPRTLETNAGIATFLHTVEFFDLGLDYDVRLPALLRAVSLADVHAVARRLLDPSRAAVVIAGPYAGE